MNITEKQPTSQDHREGVLAKTIEKQKAKLPSDSFLWLALGSIAASLTLKISGRQKDALFVGQWAPTFLVLGVYNKLVKQLGSIARKAGCDSDRTGRRAPPACCRPGLLLSHRLDDVYFVVDLRYPELF
jgi:hypothetical protein